MQINHTVRDKILITDSIIEMNLILITTDAFFVQYTCVQRQMSCTNAC